MRPTFLTVIRLLAPPVMSIAGPLLAQDQDTTVWQSTGSETYGVWARRDSAVARTLFRYLKQNDMRFLTVPDYGDIAIGLFTPEHNAALTTFGARIYADSDLTDESVRQEKYYNPYHFARYYNQALYQFVTAPDSLRQCFLGQSGPFGACPWTPLPPNAVPPLERPEVVADSMDMVAMLDAALMVARSFAEGEAPVALDGELGWDGIYRPARVGRHPDAWLRSVLARRLVACIQNAPAFKPCPKEGPLTTISMNVPRTDYQGATVITTMVTTQGTQDPTVECSMGCYFGAFFETVLQQTDSGWVGKAEKVGWIN